MTLVEFDLIPGTTSFTREAHPGVVNYLLPTPCTTIQPHIERRCQHEEKLHVFKMEQTIDTQVKTRVFLCFDKDVYVDLKQPRIRYTNITTAQVFEFL